MNAFNILVALCPMLSAASDIDDATNLMQFMQTVATGQERTGAHPETSEFLSDESQEVVRVRVDREGTMFRYVAKYKLLAAGGASSPSCQGNCGKPDKVVNATCWCDDSCGSFSDCCYDYSARCAPPDNSQMAQILALQPLPTPAPGCYDQGFYGRGPYCEGNLNTCTSMGLVVSGYSKTDGVDVCQTGWKVQCALCDPALGIVPVPTPAPAPAPALWAAPATTAGPPTGPPPTAPPAVSLPSGNPVYPPAAYDDTAVAAATAALKAAQGNASQFAQGILDAQQRLSDCKINISKAQNQAASAGKQFQSNRQAAVRYSKKRELANLTVYSAQKDMGTAYFAQQGAAQAAQDSLAAANNAGAQKRYYQKVLVDKNMDVKTAQRNADLANAAIGVASSNVDSAKKAANIYTQQQASSTKYKNGVAANANDLAQKMAVKSGMENAWGQANGNNQSDPAWKGQVPAYGGQKPY